MNRLEEIENEKRKLNEELKEVQKKNIDRQKVLDEEKASLIRQEQNKLLDKLRDNKEFILSLLDHDIFDHDSSYCSCVNNGWFGSTYNCAKCALEEVIDNPYLLPDNVKISFSVHFDCV